MAQKDYVARSQKKRKPPTRKKPKHNVAWFKVLLAILVVAAFVAGLWYLKDMEGNNANDTATELSEGSVPDIKEVPVNQSATSTNQEDEDALPEMGEEEWEFIEGLPEYSVEVDVGEMPNADKRYLMQCGSFRSKAQADELKAKIAFQGYESQVLRSEGSNGAWFRVVLGPIQPKRRAERMRHALGAANVNGCKIWAWNLD